MNVAYRLLHSGACCVMPCFLLFAFLPIIAAQNSSAYKNLETARNLAVRDTISGQNMLVYQSNPLPKNGDVDIILISSGGSGVPARYEIKYTPNTGFVGVDTFVIELNYINSFPFLVYQAYRAVVLPSKLTTPNDFAISNGGSVVTIQALANDQSSAAGLFLQSLPLVVNGTASFNANGAILFQPEPDFVGTAHLNYVVCDALNHCKTSFANIGVNNGGLAITDTFDVVTVKNGRLSMPLLYEGYAVFQAPSNGVVNMISGKAFQYVPNTNFQGSDLFVLSKTNANGAIVYKTVRVNVANVTAPNRMAVDDVVHTPRNKSITFNVRANDIGNLSVSSWVPPAASTGTLSNTSSNGQVTFKPNPNFNGIATFRYRIGNQFVPDLEMATVQVYVDNQNPVADSFDISTPINTPYVLNYKIPISGFGFTHISGPAHGTCQIFPGYTTQTINGQTISGESLVVYSPQSNYEGPDELTLRYCINATGQCDTVKLKLQVNELDAYPGPYCISDCTWPGDMNNDGVVSNLDFLSLGHSMGTNGEARPEAFPNDWFGQGGDNWNNPFLRLDADLKHHDTDGNGQAEGVDTAAIHLFYGKTHALRPRAMTGGKGMPFKLSSNTPNPQVGDVVQIMVSLGTPAKPMLNLYGFTFDLSLSPNIVDSNLHMHYLNNSWLNWNAPSFWLSKSPRRGRLETAFTRSNGIFAHGNGIFGVIEFVVTDIVDGGRPDRANTQMLEITIENPAIQYADGSSEQFEPITLRLPVHKRIAQAPAPALRIAPNPANQLVQVQLPIGDSPSLLRFFDASGRLQHTLPAAQYGIQNIDVSNWPSGIYFVQVMTAKGVVQGKFEVLR